MNARIEHITPPADASPAYELGKRAIDIALGLCGLAASLPVLAVCAAWIKLADHGPVFYSQWRVGRDGWLFRIHKLRTMRRNAEKPGAAQMARSRDPRVLRGCAWMRKSHVDELPQLWNIVRGDMSLVGPRPERPEIFEELRTDIPAIEARLAGAPGLTGLAQVRNGYTNDLDGARRKFELDLHYLRRRSILRDVALVFQTVPKFWDRSAF